MPCMCIEVCMHMERVLKFSITTTCEPEQYKYTHAYALMCLHHCTIQYSNELGCVSYTGSMVPPVSEHAGTQGE